MTSLDVSKGFERQDLASVLVDKRKWQGCILPEGENSMHYRSTERAGLSVLSIRVQRIRVSSQLGKYVYFSCGDGSPQLSTVTNF
ncbi:unnamed protein product [Echinostoma caproni]|uniref:SH2 domain-containing protein n=1 Tax=Echinostoma caproni TaxID=27848 RepID=A0A183BEH9_9TREM|nr:unnamed protein product [Echinostoma caproni]